MSVVRNQATAIIIGRRDGTFFDLFMSGLAGTLEDSKVALFSVGVAAE